MKTYDYIIIGAGSAGCNMAHSLQRNGKKVAVIDRYGIAQGASGAAGAFLSPLPGKKNQYNSFINQALDFSINFYEKLIPNEIDKKGVLRVENDNFDKQKLEENALSYKHILSKELHEISNNFRDIDGYFYENAAIVNPLTVCTKLLENCDFYKKNVKELTKEDDYYIFDDIKANNIILAQGGSTSLVKTPYMYITHVFGLKIDVKTTTKIPFNIHKSISVSTNKSDGTVAIGATQIRHFATNEIECYTTCDKCGLYVDIEDEQIESLLTQANELIKLEDLEVVKSFKGARATIKSYFPVIGKAVDFSGSLEKHPSIKNGTKIPAESLEYHDNVYIINALGSRGFVLGPYLAEVLTENILNNKEIPKEVSTLKLFYKTARK
ncbi:NAD(P)/FAD-dependent oxidoreductase [Candidatus Sulfurimonas baltica]|uniref:FAD-dependent oxidoreductase n=1 Tax=Candidatus Sulfurimonas baltica TaxID=2740404 RepID=A0A7S7LUH2_9BACT|nr:FAD-dependent oxidoreductase [Candidatus Sulfurimonas baltica]QOY51093.1 FAD-dependent oxidoreductase [Candidatus Sulfurimonas baltica]